MLCFEWWAFELLAIFSGLLSVEALAAEVVVINLVTFIFMVPLGISYSASALTGYFLGKRDFERARKYSTLTLVFNQMITVLIVVILGVFNNGISRIFTTEEKVVQVIRDVIWALLLYVFFDTLHGVQSGIIRGLGRQIYGSIWTLICYYIIGMPLALHLAFKRGMNVTGLWLGFGIACIILDIGFWVIIVTGFRVAEKRPIDEIIATPESRHLSNQIEKRKVEKLSPTQPLPDFVNAAINC